MTARAPTRHTLEKERVIRTSAVTSLIIRVQSLEAEVAGLRTMLNNLRRNTPVQ